MSCPDHSSVLAARKMSTKERPLDNFHRKVGSPCKSRTHIRLQDRVPIAYGDRRKSERFARVRGSHYLYTRFSDRSSRAESGFRDFWGGAGLVGVVITRFRVDGRHYAQMLLHLIGSARDATAWCGHYLLAYLGASEAASFWKRGSFRSGSNIGSSRSSAGVSGTFSASAPLPGIESSFSKAAMARSGSLA